MDRTLENRLTGVGGWLLVLCVWLLAWQPISVGFVASGALRALPLRGFPLVLILLFRLIVASLGVAAGVGLLTRRPSAVALARWSLVLSAAGDTLAAVSAAFPNNRAPGDTPLYLALTLIFYGAWLVYLARSKRVSATYG